MILLDTSVLAAFANSGDANHAAASKVVGEVFSGRYGPALLPEAILSEVVTVLLVRTNSIQRASEYGEKLLASCSMVYSDYSLTQAALEVFKRQKNTKLSYADSMLVAVARKLFIRKIATFDKDFLKVEGIEVVC